MGKYIEFTDISNPVLKYKTKIFAVDNKENGQRIGFIKWYGAWRQYAFFPHPNTVYEKTCLQDITDFLNKLMVEWRQSKKDEKVEG